MAVDKMEGNKKREGGRQRGKHKRREGEEETEDNQKSSETGGLWLLDEFACKSPFLTARLYQQEQAS